MAFFFWNVQRSLSHRRRHHVYIIEPAEVNRLAAAAAVVGRVGSGKFVLVCLVCCSARLLQMEACDDNDSMLFVQPFEWRFMAALFTTMARDGRTEIKLGLIKR
jgi:hypothetical protein